MFNRRSFWAVLFAFVGSFFGSQKLASPYGIRIRIPANKKYTPISIQIMGRTARIRLKLTKWNPGDN